MLEAVPRIAMVQLQLFKQQSISTPRNRRLQLILSSKVSSSRRRFVSSNKLSVFQSSIRNHRMFSRNTLELRQRRIHYLKSELARLELPRPAMMLFSAAGKEVDKYPEGKPNWEKLQHICIRLADTWPKFFVMRMDYTVFRDDVILEDRIYERYIRGVHNYRTYIGALASAGRVLYPQIEMHVLSLTPIIEDATVRMRWRIYYMNVIDWLAMLLSFNKFSPEYLKTRGRIMDGYSTYYVDASGAVYRHVVDRVIPDDEKGLAKARLTLTQRLLALLGGSPASKQAAPSA